jgi:hypothetical protein
VAARLLSGIGGLTDHQRTVGGGGRWQPWSSCSPWRQATDANAYGLQQSEPNPALGSLDVLVGTWVKSDPSGAIDRRATFEWMEGGFFLMQHVDFGGTKGIEIIGYDEASESLKSHYFGNASSVLVYTRTR